MSSNLVTMTFESNSAEAKDNSQIGLVFSDAAPSALTMVPTVMTGLLGMFNNVQATNRSLASYIASHILRGPTDTLVKFYDITDHLDGSPHGSPHTVLTFDLDPAQTAAVDYPSEVAMCVTLRSAAALTAAVEAADGSDPDLTVDRPKQRRTGRFYLGPLITGAGDASAGNVARPTVTFQDTVLDACQDLYDSISPAGLLWDVWSRKDASLYSITRVEVDNAFDTIRGRGEGPTVRTVRNF